MKQNIVLISLWPFFLVDPFGPLALTPGRLPSLFLFFYVVLSFSLAACLPPSVSPLVDLAAFTPRLIRSLAAVSKHDFV